MNALRKTDAGALLQDAIRHALAPLKGSARLTDEVIHESRRTLKNARALLRLVRPAIGSLEYRMLNDGLRDAGRALTPMRDAASLLAVASRLREKCTGRADRASLARATSTLEARRRSARRAFVRDREGRSSTVRVLERCAKRARVVGRVPMDKTIAGAALGHVYRAGRRAFAAATASSSVDALHEWRKQAKYLGRMLKALPEQAPQSKGSKQLKRLDKLGDVLGKEHDLALLAHIENDKGGLVLAPGFCGEVLAKRRAKLRKRAFALGRGSYARTPRRFVRSLGL
jgi:hypothetical protein